MNARRCFCVTLMAAMLLPVSLLADPGKDESGHGRGRGKEFSKQQEKWRKEREKAFERQKKQAEKQREAIQRQREKSREAFQRQQERRWEEIERHDERHRKSWEHRERHEFDHFAPPPRGNYVEPYHDDYGYGDQGSYPHPPNPYPAYSYDDGYPSNAYGYGAPGRFEEDLDAIYTPFGFYQDVPQPYGYGPRLEGYGQIGPYRFEVWEE